MSNYWHVECRRCKGAGSEGYNHAKYELIEAIKTAPLLAKVHEAGWCLHGAEREDGPLLNGLARFLALHASCDEFWVVSEYSGGGRGEVDIPVKLGGGT